MFCFLLCHLFPNWPYCSRSVVDSVKKYTIADNSRVDYMNFIPDIYPSPNTTFSFVGELFIICCWIFIFMKLLLFFCVRTRLLIGSLCVFESWNLLYNRKYGNRSIGDLIIYLTRRVGHRVRCDMGNLSLFR